MFLEKRPTEKEIINERWKQRWNVFYERELVMVRVVYEGGEEEVMEYYAFNRDRRSPAELRRKEQLRSERLHLVEINRNMRVRYNICQEDHHPSKCLTCQNCKSKSVCESCWANLVRDRCPVCFQDSTFKLD